MESPQSARRRESFKISGSTASPDTAVDEEEALRQWAGEDMVKHVRSTGRPVQQRQAPPAQRLHARALVQQEPHALLAALPPHGSAGAGVARRACSPGGEKFAGRILPRPYM